MRNIRAMVGRAQSRRSAFGIDGTDLEPLTESVKPDSKRAADFSEALTVFVTAACYAGPRIAIKKPRRWGVGKPKTSMTIRTNGEQAASELGESEKFLSPAGLALAYSTHGREEPPK